MKQKVQHMVKTQMQTGSTPNSVLKNNPDLARAVQLINRMETGINYNIEQLTYKELKLVEFVKNEIDKTQNKEMKKQQQEIQAQSRTKW